jgi:hypothetical protein
MTRIRLLAYCASAFLVTGTAALITAVVARSGAWWQGYVSEAGTNGQPFAVAYRMGLVLIACGAALVGLALRPMGRKPPGYERMPAPWVQRLLDGTITASALAGAAVLAGTSGVVPCSEGCPLPPYEPTTTADVVHGAASVLGMLALAVAMAAIGLADSRTAARRLAIGALALTVPIGATLGLLMLIVGRSTFGAVLERLMLAVGIGWLIATALLTALRSDDLR